ncbi:hypothetical protein JQC92_04035 [Shewanella sp. 202IG2-18]|uniref:hypothetical protein n=1 Tax=Parashewanella hymeniacidonis TaxID=2807618 RepID=UPI00195F8FD2|nr:hypothetical protein [Parashewanella hymeniacidonis]MBM7071212.1 hypothetical protein [Parashewanella hymeniacidonis]
MKLSIATTVILFCVSSTVWAHDDNQDAEVQKLRHEVRMLKKEVRHLKSVIANGSYDRGSNIQIDDGTKGQWGCYLDDITAGGVYGTGRTEAEARGKTLAACNKKGGACFDMNVKCNRSDD